MMTLIGVNDTNHVYPIPWPPEMAVDAVEQNSDEYSILFVPGYLVYFCLKCTQK